MRGRIPALLATVATTLALITTPAAAAVPLTVTPGGPADGFASPFVFTIGDLEIVCESATIHLIFESGTGRLATIPESPGADFQQCLMAGFLAVDATQVGTWTVNGTAYDPGTGVVTATVDGITVAFAAPGCAFTIAGSIGAVFANSTSELSWPGGNTLTVVHVDEVDNCADLVHEGGTGAMSGDFVISPPQTITG